MVTAEQEKWLDHLSNTNTISVVPFDPATEAKFQKLKAKIQATLGDDVAVEHHGATSLRISGQDEIDVYLPVAPEKFESLIESLKSLFGEPKSHYPSRRARFVTIEDGKHIDMFPINQDSDDWKNLVKFEAYLLRNPGKLNEYRELKEASNGLSVREYYRRKIVFINEILEL